MGLGPSIKMTTLHHFNCPLTRRLLSMESLDFSGVILTGVSESYSSKIDTAKETAKMCEKLGVDGAIVAIDGWGNHHIDFTSVIEELGTRGIKSVGISFLGVQGQLVCTNEYVDTIVDFNKCSSGVETCVVGENNLNDADAVKAIAYLKKKLSVTDRDIFFSHSGEIIGDSLVKKYYTAKLTDIINIVNQVQMYDIRKDLVCIKETSLRVVSESDHHVFVNSNLDFMPIAFKPQNDTLGIGTTFVVDNAKLMLTGVDDVSGYQPANIGSSEGYLDEKVFFNQSGTPRNTDILIHLDVVFHEGYGKSAQGIWEAHILADRVLDIFRRNLLFDSLSMIRQELYGNKHFSEKKKVALIKLSSGLGNMYDTAIFPKQPGGIIGAQNIRELGNHPVFFTPTQILDGVIHTLL